jgi:hypothetical protein
MSAALHFSLDPSPKSLGESHSLREKEKNLFMLPTKDQRPPGGVTRALGMRYA